MGRGRGRGRGRVVVVVVVAENEDNNKLWLKAALDCKACLVLLLLLYIVTRLFLSRW